LEASALNLDRLIDDICKIANTPSQRALREFWTRFYAFQEPEKVPITVGYSRWMYAEQLGIDLVQMFRSAEAHLQSSLMMAKVQREWFRDDGLVGATFGSWNMVDHINAQISLYFGPPFDTSLFGVEPVFAKDRDPVNGKPILNSPDDLDSLQYPDFYKSGMMPLAHEFYEYITKRVKGKLEVAFPKFITGPWGIAWALRGLENLIVDTFRRPDFVHKLMNFITESRIRWEKERERFLGSRIHHPHVDNDEVDCGIISPKIYKEFILPYEKRLADFYGGEIFYYHSCGNLTPILDSVTSIPRLKRIEISPWTDFQKAVELLRGRGIIIQRRLRQIPNTEGEIERLIETTVREGRGCVLEVDVVDEPLEVSQRWVKVTRSFMKSLGRSASD
jgi:hypothetical protein